MKLFEKKNHQLHTSQSHLGFFTCLVSRGNLKVDLEVDPQSNEIDPKSDNHKTYVF